MLRKFTPEGAFECGFDDAVKGKVCALVAVVRSEGMGLGIAVANERGYIPIPLTWCNGDDYRELEHHADELNKEFFQLDTETASNIVASSMR